mmetsp:Transcript_72443/g.234118  ORF Transcript_72443/g.234118 Transcript_72443/m.234118 type:complete len:430 (-) Transcript_72443:21-1310(-)
MARNCFRHPYQHSHKSTCQYVPDAVCSLTPHRTRESAEGPGAAERFVRVSSRRSHQRRWRPLSSGRDGPRHLRRPAWRTHPLHVQSNDPALRLRSGRGPRWANRALHVLEEPLVVVEGSVALELIQPRRDEVDVRKALLHRMLAQALNGLTRFFAVVLQLVFDVEVDLRPYDEVGDPVLIQFLDDNDFVLLPADRADNEDEVKVAQAHVPAVHFLREHLHACSWQVPYFHVALLDVVRSGLHGRLGAAQLGDLRACEDVHQGTLALSTIPDDRRIGLLRPAGGLEELGHYWILLPLLLPALLLILQGLLLCPSLDLLALRLPQPLPLCCLHHFHSLPQLLPRHRLAESRPRLMLFLRAPLFVRLLSAPARHLGNKPLLQFRHRTTRLVDRPWGHPPLVELVGHVDRSGTKQWPHGSSLPPEAYNCQQMG